MTTTDTAWEQRAAQLADALTSAGVLDDPAWQRAIREVPRHVFVPTFHRQPHLGGWEQVSGADPEQTEDWLDAVYANIPLVTALDDRGSPVSSSSQPSLMTRMLEMLAVEDGHRVLEIGTGTGYNAGLLSHRLGDEYVSSVDIDFIVDARNRLADIGYQPHLVERDGSAGWPDHAPFDRIIATCAVPRVPWAWAEQVVDGGLVLVDVKIETSAGNLVLLRRDGDKLEGRFARKWAGFMSIRHTTATAIPPRAAVELGDRERTTTAPAQPWQDELVVWFMAAVNLPAGVSCGYVLDERTGQPRAAMLSVPDGSSCTVSLTVGRDGSRIVREGGSTPLWEHVETAHDRWQAAGRPGWERLGMTVTPDEQTVWLDDPGACVAHLAISSRVQ